MKVPLIFLSVIVCCSFSLFVVAQTCPTSRGSQSGNYGSGGSGYSITFRKSVDEDKKLTIYKKFERGKPALNMKIEFFSIDSASANHMRLKQKSDTIRLDWKIPSTRKSTVKKDD